MLSARYEGDATRAAARAKAERALGRIRAGEPFPAVAAELSEEPGAEGRQGLLPPGREGSWVDEFWEAALALELGEISPVVETQYGFHVLRLENREAIPFEEARNVVTLEVAQMVGVRPADDPPVGPPDGLRVSSEEDLSARLQDHSAPDSAEAARWSTGALALGELRDRFSTLPLEAYDALLDPARPPRLIDEVEAAVRWRAAADEARARGFSADEAHRASLILAWTNQAGQWASPLGFHEGLGVEGVKAASLDALRTTGQNASLARTELLERAPLLRRAAAKREARGVDG